jgi:hypothetical protein
MEPVSFIIIATGILLIITVFISLLFGVFLSIHTCEELKSFSSLFEITKTILAVSSIVILAYILFGFNINAIITTIIFAAMIYLLRNQKYLNEFIFYSLFIIVPIIKDPIYASFVFATGTLIGTIESKNKIFEIHKKDHDKFTTETKFPKKEQLNYYRHVFIKFQLGLYIGMIIFIVSIIL